MTRAPARRFAVCPPSKGTTHAVVCHAGLAQVGEHGEIVRSPRVESAAQANFAGILQVVDRAAQVGFLFRAAALTGKLLRF
jgi:hypothetical protein